MGLQGHGPTEIVTGDHPLAMTTAFGALNKGDRVNVNFAEPGGGSRYRDNMLCPVAFFPESNRALATMNGRPIIVAHRLPNDNAVYTCGFPLGFTYLFKHNELRQPDAMNPIFGEMLTRAGVVSPVDAPASLGVWVSDNANLLLVKKRGDWDTGPITLPNVGHCAYTKAKNVFDNDDLRLDLALPQGRLALWLERLARIEGGSDVVVSGGTVEGDEIDRLRFTISGRGHCQIALNLWPDSDYDVTIGDRRQRVRSNREGLAELPLNLERSLDVEASRRRQ